MSANEENLDGIEPDELERLKRTVLEQIEGIGTKPGTQEDKVAWAGRIKAWFDLLKEIEIKIEDLKKGS